MDEEQDLMLQVMEAREELEDAEGDEVKELLEVNRRSYILLSSACTQFCLFPKF
jgi:hypothetical protein